MSSSSLQQVRADRPFRDTRLDFFRGLALVIMMVDHLRGTLSEVTYQSFGFVSAAELFIFMSGMVAGMVYTRRFEHFGFARVRTLCWRRAGLLYVYHVGFSVAAILIASMFAPIEEVWRLFPFRLKETVFFEEPGRAVFMTSVLIYQPGPLAILPMYMFFLFFLPYALWVLNRRMGSLVIFLLAISVWFASGHFEFAKWSSNHVYKPLGVRGPWFVLLSWQCLFWFGLICGRARQMKDKAGWLNSLIRFGWKPAAMLSVLLLLLRHDIISQEWSRGFFDLKGATHVRYLGWLRLLNFLGLFLTVTCLAIRWPQLFKGRWLSLLGQHSLQVFTAHLAILFLLAPIWVNLKNTSLVVECLWTVFALILLTLTAWGHERFQESQKNRGSSR